MHYCYRPQVYDVYFTSSKSAVLTLTIIILSCYSRNNRSIGLSLTSHNNGIIFIIVTSWNVVPSCTYHCDFLFVTYMRGSPLLACCSLSLKPHNAAPTSRPAFHTFPGKNPQRQAKCRREETSADDRPGKQSMCHPSHIS